MGGSILGIEAIHQFLKHKIKKDFYFVNNLQSKIDLFQNNKKKSS
jgi:glucose-6-phosphate isomerase